MKAFAAIVQMWFLTRWRSPGRVLAMVLTPLAFVLVFGYLESGGSAAVRLGIVQTVPNPVTEAAIHWWEKDAALHVSVVSRETAKIDLEQGSLDEVLMLQRSFATAVIAGQPAPVSWFQSPGSSTAGQVFFAGSPTEIAFASAVAKAQETARTAAIDGVSSNRVGVLAAGALEMSPTNIRSAWRIASGSVGLGGALTPLQAIVIGFPLLFVTLQAFAGAEVMLLYRKNGTWWRLIHASEGSAPVIGGFSVAIAIEGFLQWVAILTLCRILLGVSFGYFWLMGLIGALFVAAAVGLALLLTVVITEPDVYRVIANAIAIGGAMLSGLMWPLEIEPRWLQPLAGLFAQRWAYRGLEMAVLGQHLTAGYWSVCGVLALFAALFLAGGAARLRFE